MFGSLNKIQKILVMTLHKTSTLGNIILSINSLNENTTMTIGSGYNGAIDQLLILLEAKPSQKILWDATVAAFYPFEGQTNSIPLDLGPHSLNGTVAGIQSVPGRVRNAVSFNASGGYVQASGFTVLNIAQHGFTIVLWIRPSIKPGIFLTIANSVSCLLVLGLRNSDYHLVTYLPNSTNTNTGTNLIGSELLIYRWTHIAFTWSNDNQAQLYQDTIWQSSNHNATKLNNGYGNPMTITLGMYHDNVNCAGGDGLESIKQFTGSLDEFYVFSRELKQSQIKTFVAITN